MTGFFRRIMSGRKLGGPIRRDSGLQKVVDGVLEGCEYVLAVGEGASETVLYLGARHPNLECLACEPKSETFFEASDKASRLKNVYMHNASPSDFMKMIESDKPYLFSRDSLFIISAAGGGPERRVPQEVEFVSGRFQAAFLLVLGFKVPEREDFGVTTHRGRECSMKNLAPNLKGAEYTLYYPAYDVPGSKRRRLPGWGLFTLGRNAEYEFSDEIKEMLTKV